METPVISLNELAQATGINYSTLYSHYQRGNFPGYKEDGTVYLFDNDLIQSYVEKKLDDPNGLISVRSQLQSTEEAEPETITVSKEDPAPDLVGLNDHFEALLEETWDDPDRLSYIASTVDAHVAATKQLVVSARKRTRSLRRQRLFDRLLS